MLEGLTLVPDEALKRLLQAVHHGRIALPVDAVSLAMNGLQDYGEPLLAQLRGLDERGVRAVLALVLAERHAARAGRIAPSAPRT